MQPRHASQPPPALNFLQGGGDMGARIRAFDWTATPLGPPEQWPIGLKTAVRIMLTSRQAMWIGWGPQLTYLYNDPYKSIIGGKHPSALGQPTSVVWREIWPDIAPMLETAMGGDQGTYVESQLLIMERNGYPEETYYTFSYSPIPDDDDRAGGIICANTDTTENVIRERQLAMLRLLAAVSADARTVGEACAGSARALETNPRDVPFALIYLLDQARTALTLCASSTIGPEHPAAPASIPLSDAGLWPAADVLSARAPRLMPLPAMEPPFPSGAWQRPPAQALIAPLAPRGQDEPTGLLVLGLNPYRLFDESYAGFTQLLASQVAAAIANARAYEEERRRAEALAEIDRAKTVFFSNVSHEFRTPLTLMLGPLDDLRAHAESPDVREQAALIHRNALRLLRLVNTLLDFSRIEAGRAQAIYEPVDLASYTADLASIFRSAIERAGLRLVVDCPPMDDVFVDRQMWERIVLNLLSNAFKYTLEGEIRVTVRREGDQVRLDVADTGTGIPASELPRIFDRFHRIEGARGRTHEGTGIGLALVQELVKLHGGTVAAESEEGRGATFTVTMPIGTRHLPADRIRSESSASAVSTAANPYLEEALRWLPGETPSAVDAGMAVRETASSAAQRERILLADDNADMRDYVSRLLQTRWTVTAVENGRAALEAARRQRPHLVLTDVMMPDLDGFGLVAALRDDPDLLDVPVIMLSARAGEEATLEGLQAADDYLVKPFSARELIARVEAQLLRARIREVEERHSRRLASVFTQAPVAIALLRGPDHVFELANPTYLELVRHRDVVGKPVREALPEVASQGLIALLDRVYASGEPSVGRSLPLTVNRGPHGEPEECYFDFVYQPLFDAAGHVERIAAVVYDVTALARARQEAEVANRAKDEFLAMLGHELRNPLAPILTALQLLRLRGVDAIERERLVIERQVGHLVSLVDDLLDISRITRGKIQLQRTRTEIAEVIAKSIEMSSPLLEQNRHVLRVDVPAHGLLVDADTGRLAQVFSNLVTNAAKYTEPGGQITIAAVANGGDVVVTVRDTGIGIASDILPRIFDLFVQERQALDRARGGLGLGLAIVRSLVTMHGGSVSASSDGPGRGAEFTVRLPLGLVADVQPAAVEPGASLTAQLATVRRRILVVDDNQDAAAMLAEFLGAYGHEVRCAHDGPTALDTARAFQPEVALLDIGLPVMDGYELARRFQDDPSLQRTRIVAVTGYGQERDRERSATIGFSAHVVKPVDLDRLRSIVEEP